MTDTEKEIERIQELNRTMSRDITAAIFHEGKRPMLKQEDFDRELKEKQASGVKSTGIVMPNLRFNDIAKPPSFMAIVFVDGTAYPVKGDNGKYELVPGRPGAWQYTSGDGLISTHDHPEFKEMNDALSLALNSIKDNQ